MPWASYTQARRMVRESFANKCAYVCRLWTCSAPFANGSHTIHRVPKFVSFLREHKENWMHRCFFHAPGILCSSQVRRKLINGAPNTRCMQTTQRVSGALLYTNPYMPVVNGNFLFMQDYMLCTWNDGCSNSWRKLKLRNFIGQLQPRVELDWTYLGQARQMHQSS